MPRVAYEGLLGNRLALGDRRLAAVVVVGGGGAKEGGGGDESSGSGHARVLCALNGHGCANQAERSLVDVLVDWWRGVLRGSGCGSGSAGAVDVAEAGAAVAEDNSQKLFQAWLLQDPRGRRARKGVVSGWNPKASRQGGVPNVAERRIFRVTADSQAATRMACSGLQRCHLFQQN